MIADAAARLAEWWAPFLAFVAGAVSFASPCVFPLVPGYVSFVSGGAVRTPDDPGPRLLPMLLFVAGFTVVFTLFGAPLGVASHPASRATSAVRWSISSSVL